MKGPTQERIESNRRVSKFKLRTYDAFDECKLSPEEFRFALADMLAVNLEHELPKAKP